jgi:GntR family transcriptional regulator / MocR family aminotransferase
MSKARFLLELPLPLDRTGPVSLARQLSGRIRDAIAQGSLLDGTKLPSSRILAAELEVSRGVVTAAYEQLAAGGFLLVAPRSVPRVQGPPAAPEAVPPAAARPLYDFTAIAPDLSLFPRLEWLRAVQEAIRSAPDAALDYPPPQGFPELRRELAAYLGRVRGVRAQPSQVIITQGFSEAFEIITRILARRGARSIAVENPYDPYFFGTARRSGLGLTPLPVDARGACVADLAATSAGAALLSPACQFPIGGVLDARRRRQALDWARDTSGVIIEDDYNAEYRFDRTPVAALQGLDPNWVCYAGSTSKVLAPGLRIGWLVVPRDWLAEARQEKEEQGGGSPGLDQLALASFLGAGALDEHLRRTRRTYARRRHRFIRLIEHYLPHASIAGAAAGLHVTVLLGREVDMPAFLGAAAAAGIHVRDLSSYAFAPHQHGQGIVLGYSRIREASAAAALERLAALLAEHPAG